ncbi:MAG TPA: SAM-dependent chlorinase/fluorinase [Gemmatimonadaceae bacterium]|nr:SAM-dependent chlorinase/fluorinase [Gemmatimonadaceae bacterium]
MRPIITLLTDFGTADGYVAELKGVLLSAVPDLTMVDLSHEIAAQDVEAARLAVARYWRRFPSGTVHLVVVDPGVGSDRNALAVSSDDRFLVGPDNGVLSPALLAGGSRAVSLPVPPNASATFHGRDVFAPAAALLATGTAIDALGGPCLDPVIRRTPEARRASDGSVVGEIIAVDRFGNAISNLIAPRGGRIEIRGRTMPIVRTYADGPVGDIIALVGSSGFVEIAQRDGSAARALEITRGTRVTLRAPGA